MAIEISFALDDKDIEYFRDVMSRAQDVAEKATEQEIIQEARTVLEGVDHSKAPLFVRDRLARLDSPRELGEPLAGSKLGNYWKYRVGDWRIICDLQDKRIVVRVLRVGNRREVYR